MDSFGSLALATEPPNLALLDGPPYRREEYIVNRKMVKHITVMALYMIIVIYSIVFAGEHFFPEPDIYWRIDRPDVPFLFPGRLNDWDGSELYSKFKDAYGPSRHMTNVFNIFVILQIFNLINARRIEDEMNVFSGIFNNWMFCSVWIGITVSQVIIIEFTSIAFKVSYGGLHGYHWLIAVCLGFSTLGVAAITKLLPDTLCCQFGDKREDPLQEKSTNILNLRK